MNGLKLTKKTVVGVDFNVVCNPTTHEVKQTDSKYISEGEVITSFTIKDGNIVTIGHHRGEVDDSLQFASDNIFKFISPIELIKMVEGMQDHEYKYLEGLKIIRLLNFYTS